MVKDKRQKTEQLVLGCINLIRYQELQRQRVKIIWTWQILRIAYWEKQDRQRSMIFDDSFRPIICLFIRYILLSSKCTLKRRNKIFY